MCCFSFFFVLVDLFCVIFIVFVSSFLIYQNHPLSLRMAFLKTTLQRMWLPAPAPITTHWTTELQKGNGRITPGKRSPHFGESAPTPLRSAQLVHTEELRVRLKTNQYTLKLWCNFSNYFPMQTNILSCSLTVGIWKLNILTIVCEDSLWSSYRHLHTTCSPRVCGICASSVRN